MKKITILSLFSAFLLVGLNATAQERGDVRISVTLAAGTKAAVDDNLIDSKFGLGVNLGAEYLIANAVSLAPSYTLFFKNSVGGTDLTKSAINIDARYYIGKNGFYGLAGFSSLRAKTEATGFSQTDTSEGVNVGAGVMCPFTDSLFTNIQVKYQSSDEGQVVINAGIAFGF